MKYSAVLLAGLVHFATASILNPRKCAGDNCNRAVTGTDAGPAVPISRLSDCNSYFATFVTPATITSTITAFSTVATSTPPPVKHKRTINNNTPVTSTPTAIPAYVSTACECIPTISISVRWSSACSCAGATHATTILPAPVVYTTVTSATTAVLPTVSCTNYGLEWAAWHFVSGAPFIPESYKTESPVLTGTADTYTFVGPSVVTTPVTIFGSTSTIETNLLVIDFRGYFIAEQSGTYTFHTDFVGDHFYLWIGPTAYSGWDASNADLFAYYYTIQTVTYSFTLTPGIYPIRYMWGSVGGNGNFGYTLRAPDGTILVTETTVNSPYFVTYCSAAGAPAYPAWGIET